jgi:hypothetical protein
VKTGGEGDAENDVDSNEEEEEEAKSFGKWLGMTFSSLVSKSNG